MAQSFFGGIHPHDKKGSTSKKPTEILPAPAYVAIPMSLHAGTPCTPCVAVGERVKMGQLIGACAEGISAPIHASVSGVVTAVEERPQIDGSMVLSVVIENDFEDAWHESVTGAEHPEALSAEQLLEIVKNAGIVGMGGAAFPTHVKISEGMGKVDTVIINAAESGPYITADHRLLLEYPEDVLGGAKLLARMFHVDKVHIGIEANKMNAVELLRRKIEEDRAPAVIDILHRRYPQGAEKQICHTITGRQVPPGELPAAIGCAVFNVATAAAIYRAVYHGMPLISRIVTVSGSGVVTPKNLVCPIGASVSDLLDCCGGVQEKTFQIIAGGTMMGTALRQMDVSVGKGTNAVTVLAKDEDKTVEHPTCIHCGRCISVCPMHLQPLFLHMYERKGKVAELERANVTDCIECGACDYICPGRMQLAQAIRSGKAMVMAAKQEEKEG